MSVYALDDLTVSREYTATEPLILPDGIGRSPMPSVEQGPTNKAEAQPIGAMSTINNTLKQWRLHWIWLGLSRILSQPESRGCVAIYRSFAAAFFASWLHLLPMFSIIAILYFFFADAGYFLGWELAGQPGHDTEKFYALQLAAKILELLVVFSLTNLIFTILRNEVLKGHTIPLAAFTAGLQFASPDYIWSKELWALMSARFPSRWKKFIFISLLVLCTALAISIAPSAAIVIAPQILWWQAGGAIVWLNASRADLFPDNLGPWNSVADDCLVTGNILCPSSNWEQLRDGHIAFLGDSGLFGPNIGLLRDSGEFRSNAYPLPAVTRGSHSNVAYWPYSRDETGGFTVASMGNHAIVDGAVMAAVHWNTAAFLATYRGMARKFAWRFDTSISTNPMPVAWGHTRCASTSVIVGSRDVRPIFPDFRNMDFKDVHLPDPDGKMDAWLNSTLSSLSRPEPFWFDLDGETAHNASIGGIVAVPTSNVSVVDLYGCITDARWVDAPYYPNYTYLQATHTPIHPPVSDPNWGHRCHINPTFAHYLMPAIRSTNRTVLQEMLRATSFWSEGPGLQQWGSSRYVPDLESVLNILMVNGMASTAPYTTPFNAFNNSGGAWWMDFMPEGPQSSAYGRPSRTPYNVQGNLSNYISFSVDADVQGYAYRRQDISTNVAIICLILYLPLGLGIVFWNWTTRITSSAWDSISELLLLTLKSHPPPTEFTEGTPAGLLSMKSLRALYCIVEDENTSLELKHAIAIAPPEEAAAALSLEKAAPTVPLAKRVRLNVEYT